MPERFHLKYIGADNAEHTPVLIHRAIFGSFERFIALLIEHYAGAFPLWLAPVQVSVLPIGERHVAYARSVAEDLARAGLRAVLDERNEKLGFKVREAEVQKIPLMLVVGDQEQADGTVTPRWRRGGDPKRGAVALPELVADLVERVTTRRAERPS